MDSLFNIQHSFYRYFPSASGLKERQREIFQMVDLCLRLDQPQLLCSLTVPLSVLGDHVPDAPSVKQWLSESLRSVVAEQPESRLQEMVVEENFIVIGKKNTLKW